MLSENLKCNSKAKCKDPMSEIVSAFAAGYDQADQRQAVEKHNMVEKNGFIDTFLQQNIELLFVVLCEIPGEAIAGICHADGAALTRELVSVRDALRIREEIASRQRILIEPDGSNDRAKAEIYIFASDGQ